MEERPEYMSLPIELSHRLVRKLAELMRNGDLEYL